jgi:hypothetical protein
MRDDTLYLSRFLPAFGKTGFRFRVYESEWYPYTLLLGTMVSEHAISTLCFCEILVFTYQTTWCQGPNTVLPNFTALKTPSIRKVWNLKQTVLLFVMILSLVNDTMDVPRYRQLSYTYRFVVLVWRTRYFTRYSADHRYATLLKFMVDELKNSKTLWRATSSPTRTPCFQQASQQKRLLKTHFSRISVTV